MYICVWMFLVSSLYNISSNYNNKTIILNQILRYHAFPRSESVSVFSFFLFLLHNYIFLCSFIPKFIVDFKLIHYNIFSLIKIDSLLRLIDGLLRRRLNRTMIMIIKYIHEKLFNSYFIIKFAII